MKPNSLRLTIEPEKPFMSQTYYQNRSAWAALQPHVATSVDFGEDYGTVKDVSFNTVSSLDCIGDTELLKTFRDTRANNNNGAANQSILVSFDPAFPALLHTAFQSQVKAMPLL